MQAVTLPYPPFLIDGEYAPLVAAFQRGIGISSAGAAAAGATVPLTVTVVHWRCGRRDTWPVTARLLTRSDVHVGRGFRRRGDQLTSRCSARQAKDTSVNCRGAADLHAALTQIQNQTLNQTQNQTQGGVPRRAIYIATNEAQNSSELE